MLLFYPSFAVNIVRAYRLLTEHISRMFLQGETPDPSDNCSGNRYH